MKPPVSLVTGAASGIGAATARILEAQGSGGLVLVDRDGAGLEALAAELSTPTLLRVQDVADPAAWTVTEAATRERFGRLDHAVVNAGIADAAPIVDMDFAAWRRVLSVNLDGAFLTLQSAMRLMGDGAGGAIVVVSSAAGVKAEPGTGAYAASKAGAAHLARVAAKEGAQLGIRVNAVAPGGVETPIWRSAAFFVEMAAQAGGEKAAFEMMAKAGTPLGRFAGPEEVAALIAFLLSDAAGVTTGALVVSDGGYSV